MLELYAGHDGVGCSTKRVLRDQPYQTSRKLSFRADGVLNDIFTDFRALSFSVQVREFDPCEKYICSGNVQMPWTIETQRMGYDSSQERVR